MQTILGFKKISVSSQEDSIDPSADTKDMMFKEKNLALGWQHDFFHQESDLWTSEIKSFVKGGIIDLADVQSMNIS